MKFWSSAEASPEVISEYRAIRNTAELYINQSLQRATLSLEWQSWTWAFIGIVISPALGVSYPERVRRNSKDRVLEFRLAIDFTEFLKGNEVRRIDLMLDQIERSVSMMGKWGIKAQDRACLKTIVDEVRAQMKSGGGEVPDSATGNAVAKKRKSGPT